MEHTSEIILTIVEAIPDLAEQNKIVTEVRQELLRRRRARADQLIKEAEQFSNSITGI